jgi:hypothetical protein
MEVDKIKDYTIEIRGQIITLKIKNTPFTLGFTARMAHEIGVNLVRAHDDLVSGKTLDQKKRLGLIKEIPGVHVNVGSLIRSLKKE